MRRDNIYADLNYFFKREFKNSLLVYLVYCFKILIDKINFTKYLCYLS